MTSADIVADENSNPGVYLLKQWLEYSATNVLETGVNSFREPDSAFEEYVIAQIENMGCQAVPQVGVSGYFVDIGVKHPDWPHGYILGVECDGASYHSSKSARDRDRLREEVLTNLGWDIYRIWSTDWFENPRAEAEKLRNKITERLQELKENEGDFYPKTEIIDVDDSTVEEKVRVDNARYDTRELFDNVSKNDDSITESRARTLLIRLRDQEIAEEFEDSITERGILNDNMIELLLIKKPTTPGNFRNCIPLSIREKIDHQQMIYLNSILDIIRRIR
jgi:very-short-patch-repair endonuclease